jgi:hypothetical protein
MEPTGVGSGQKLEYSNASPGSSVGCSPTTPGPATRCSCPSASVMIHVRLINWARVSPVFEILTKYANRKRPSPG